MLAEIGLRFLAVAGLWALLMVTVGPLLLRAGRPRSGRRWR